MFRDYDHYHRTRYDAFQKTGLATCFHYCFLMEYMLRFCPRLRWPLSRGHSVVCDRYVFDAVIGLAANLHYSDDRTRDTIDRILRLMPTPDLVFLIDLPEDTAFHRKSDIPSLSYLAERRRMYLRLAEDYRMIILDGSRPAAEIQDMARDAVAGCFSDRRQAG